MNESTLLRLVCETGDAHLALGNERFERDGAVFVRNWRTPKRYDANNAGLVRAGSPAELDRLMQAMDEEYAGFGHRAIHIDALTPPQVSARLELEGYSSWSGLHFVLEGKLRAAPKPDDIREVLSDSDWAHYGQLDAMNYAENDSLHNRPFEGSLMDEFLVSKRLKSPPVRVWMAYIEDEPRAYFSSWPGENGVGMVEDLFTHPDFRHRGLATALIAHCVADARERGAGPVVIIADPADTPKHLYAAMGWRPMFVGRMYSRVLASPTGSRE